LHGNPHSAVRFMPSNSSWACDRDHKIVEVTRPRQPTPGGSSSRTGRGFLLLGGRPVHCGRPLSSNFLSGILHRMQTPVMKSNLCPPACRSMAITVLLNAGPSAAVSKQKGQRLASLIMFKDRLRLAGRQPPKEFGPLVLVVSSAPAPCIRQARRQVSGRLRSVS
jgi:hypothetical protein